MEKHYAVRPLPPKEADYILAVKDNQKKLYKEVQEMFELRKAESVETIEKNNGRIETRKCSILIPKTIGMRKMNNTEDWEGLQSIVRIESTREIKGVKGQETRYYISSLKISAEKMNAYVREHWCVENKLHWSLDVSFKEDTNRTRTDNSAENLSIIRRVGLNLLKTDTTMKVGIAAKRKTAGWNTQYLEAILHL
jgi:predicted transposase YbfD/YdcC